ncbi:MAG: hypothetical protein BWX80_03461 [Candidatus Hydrogenedentes bacterium ADurb.Bin101]|nr:MAG: hypothetical protein BWX80_03461 [Candidatus Hydrogenedentes bacterium ADurb.Bin101]
MGLDIRPRALQPRLFGTRDQRHDFGILKRSIFGFHPLDQFGHTQRAAQVVPGARGNLLEIGEAQADEQPRQSERLGQAQPLPEADTPMHTISDGRRQRGTQHIEHRQKQQDGKQGKDAREPAVKPPFISRIGMARQYNALFARAGRGQHCGQVQRGVLRKERRKNVPVKNQLANKDHHGQKHGNRRQARRNPVQGQRAQGQEGTYQRHGHKGSPGNGERFQRRLQPGCLQFLFQLFLAGAFARAPRGTIPVFFDNSVHGSLDGTCKACCGLRVRCFNHTPCLPGCPAQAGMVP